MSKRKSQVPDNETGQEKFRRVIDQRLKPLIARLRQIKDMPYQPAYKPDDNDIRLLIRTIENETNSCLTNWKKALDGTLKQKEREKFNGVNWDEALEENTE